APTFEQLTPFPFNLPLRVQFDPYDPTQIWISTFGDGLWMGRTAPLAPTALAATAGAGQVSLSWHSSTSATSYNVYRGTSSGQEILLVSGLTGTSFTDTGVSGGVTYYYIVTAVNSAGEGGRSNGASATPQTGGASATSGVFFTDGINQLWMYQNGKAT